MEAEGGAVREVAEKTAKSIDSALERYLELYEKRTYVLERIAMALEHRNEKQFHSV